jgi:hypothetical protein
MSAMASYFLLGFRHSVVRSECSAARDGGSQVKTWSVEEHRCKAYAVLGHVKVICSSEARLRGKKPGHLVIGDAHRDSVGQTQVDSAVLLCM